VCQNINELQLYLDIAKCIADSTTALICLLLIMLKVFIYFISIVYCNCEIILTPLSVTNPYKLIANVLPQHNVILSKSYQKDINLDPLQLLFNYTATAFSRPNTSDHCTISLETFGKDVYSRENYAIQSKILHLEPKCLRPVFI